MFNKRLLFTIGLLVTGLVGASSLLVMPAFANGGVEQFVTGVVFKRALDIRDGIRNTVGAVKVRDDLTVTGNLRVGGESDLEIDARDVVIRTRDVSSNNPNTYLESTNLQNALDNELAVNLSDFLPGTTWTVTNITSDTIYANSTGQVTFSSDGIVLDAGRLAALGITHDDEETGCSPLLTDISYDLYMNSIIYANWTTGSAELSYDHSAVVSVFVQSKDSIGLIGSGGCGEVGVDRISILTRVTD